MVGSKPAGASDPLIVVARVIPRAAQDAIALEDGQLRVRLRAAPVDGAASAALITLLAARLRLPKRAITIIQGQTARVKRIAIEGLSADDLRQRLSASEPGKRTPGRT